MFTYPAGNTTAIQHMLTTTQNIQQATIIKAHLLGEVRWVRKTVTETQQHGTNAVNWVCTRSETIVL